MAMAFMARQVRLLNNTVVLGLLLVACSHSEKIKWVESENGGFKVVKGVTYFEKEKFTGIRYQCYASHDTAMVIPYRDGLQHGVARTWFDGNRLASLRYFEHGKMQGKHTGWHENGKLKFIYYFEDDLFQGNVKEWTIEGEPYRDFNYAEGHEAGLQKMWEADGRLKANYEVRNGRKYGLAGSKNCTSPNNP
jgi:antitoxin component YwqK of YwqJK toxin-antitoxin module